MRTLLPLLLFVPMAACANRGSAGRSPVGLYGDRVILIDDAGRQYRSTESAGPVETTVDGTVEAVWRALPAVYDALGVPLAHVDRPSGQLGNRQLVRTGRVAGARLSRAFDCGFSMTGPRADEGRITASVITQVWVRPDGRTGIATTITSTVRPVSGSSTDPTSCASTGWLENEIARRLRSTVTG